METEKLTKYQLERKISEAIHKDNGSAAHFIWEYKPNKVVSTVIGFLELKVVTLNPTHTTHFLLHRVEKNLYNNVNIQDLYCAILQEVIDIFILKQKSDSPLLHYAVGWRDRTNPDIKFKTITSYFSGKSFKEIMEKFFFEKNENDIIIDSVTLLPDT
tara:strand:+ start:288 stop:761 length:474 start_codon:yes stop_codon:yes gene_type:complete